MKSILSLICLLSVSFAAQAKVFQCVGTEPFWGAQIDTQKQVTKLSSPGDSSSVIRTKITQAAGTGGYFAFAAQGKYVTLAVTSNESCSDGMSDERYTHSVLILGYGKTPLFGCCR